MQDYSMMNINNSNTTNNKKNTSFNNPNNNLFDNYPVLNGPTNLFDNTWTRGHNNHINNSK
jgi:hypothetical protein